MQLKCHSFYLQIESYMTQKTIKKSVHNHLMSGYYLNCINEQYSKEIKLLDKLEDFRDNIIKELDYIENINENVFNHEIDMSTFDKEKFDKITHCKYCNHDFNQKYNGRVITLREKVEHYKLKTLIDDFEYNNINKETQDNLIKYYNSLDNNSEVNIIYKQSLIQEDIILKDLDCKICLMR